MVNDFFVRLTFIIQTPWPASSLETQTSPLHLFTKPLPPIFPALFFRFNSRGEGGGGGIKTLGEAPVTSWPLLGHLLCLRYSLHSRSLAPVGISGICPTAEDPPCLPRSQTWKRTAAETDTVTRVLNVLWFVQERREWTWQSCFSY